MEKECRVSCDLVFGPDTEDSDTVARPIVRDGTFRNTEGSERYLYVHDGTDEVVEFRNFNSLSQVSIQYRDGDATAVIVSWYDTGDAVNQQSTTLSAGEAIMVTSVNPDNSGSENGGIEFSISGSANKYANMYITVVGTKETGTITGYP